MKPPLKRYWHCRIAILAESKHEEAQNTERFKSSRLAHQMPLGPTAEVVIPRQARQPQNLLQELDMDCKVHVRFAIDRVKVLTTIEGLPDTIITLSEQLLQALTDYAPAYSTDAEGE